jgi:hypothetical protein
LDAAELAATTVVFDARGAPPGLPRVLDHHGLAVRFAVRYESADTLIEELIQADSTPRRLTVVSSDHRIQRAARRRKAKAVDSDVWYAELVRCRAGREAQLPADPDSRGGGPENRSAPRESRSGVRENSGTPARPSPPLVADEVARWLEAFGGEAIVEKLIEEEGARPPSTKAIV